MSALCTSGTKTLVETWEQPADETEHRVAKFDGVGTTSENPRAVGALALHGECLCSGPEFHKPGTRRMSVIGSSSLAAEMRLVTRP